ncbi:hypothetical protein IFM89_001713 [Coptis chinensis]|uniref:Phytocyanin domain-containing protein n=1 Tax=Coptis chinensis TaxID=261450 RepID=A0A835LP78_9MAGN|nr:hypothetical protein IFM89_001713 [Coptis chinensis]
MVQGRGSACQAMSIAISLLVLLLAVHGKTVNATEFRVGDLVFNYLPENNNVIAVDLNGYNKCMAPAASKRYRSGNDHITLTKGQNSFICDIPGHCDQLGQRITLKAA